MSFRRMLLGFAAAVAACSATPLTSVPGDSAAPGYHIGMVLELRQERLLQSPQGLFNPAPADLVRHGTATTGGVVSIEEYRNSPQTHREIIGIVPAGTRLVVTSINRRTYPGLEPWYEVTAQFLSGSFADRSVSVDRLSANGTDGRTPLVDVAEFAVVP